MKKAIVYYKGEKAALLTKSSDGYVFQYVKSYIEGTAIPISYSLPLSDKKFESKILFPFFSGLVSEGWLLEIQTKIQKIDETDYFSLLIHNGKDLVGAVTVEEAMGHEL